MKKNIVIAVMAGLVIVFFHLWQSAVMREESHKKKVAELAETISSQMKKCQEDFKWEEFLRRTGVEDLLVKSMGVNGRKVEEIRLEINKRLLGYPREINVAESHRDLIQKLLQSPFGKEFLAFFVAGAKETIRIYEEEKR